MGEIKYTDKQISDLRDALGKSGVALPENIERIASGNYGVCIVSENAVIKLFKASADPELVSFEHAYFDKSVSAYLRVSGVADEITRRGIKVPEMLSYGKLEIPHSYRRRTLLCMANYDAA